MNQRTTAYRAAIFDLDGVIVDTAKYHYLAWKELAECLKIEFTPQDNERLKGVSRMESLNILLEIGGMTCSQQEKERLAAIKNERYIQYIQQLKPSDILDGALEFLQAMKRQNIKTALASASKNARMILQGLNLEQYFDAVADGTVATKAKPDPEVFLIAAQLLGEEPSSCIGFEDSFAGIEAIKAAGMKAVGLGDAKILYNADIVFAGLAQVPATLEIS